MRIGREIDGADLQPDYFNPRVVISCLEAWVRTPNVYERTFAILMVLTNRSFVSTHGHVRVWRSVNTKQGILAEILIRQN